MRTENCEIYITDSSARMLSKETRYTNAWKGPFLGDNSIFFSRISAIQRDRIQEPRYLLKKDLQLVKPLKNTGRQGFPEVIELEKPLRIKTHQEYFHAVLFRGLIERYDVSHPKVVNDIAHWLIDNTGSLYSINRLIGNMKSLRHKTSKETISNYLSWFQDTYFLFTVRLFDASISRSNANPKKIYCIDHALVTSVASGILVNAGHLAKPIEIVITGV